MSHEAEHQSYDKRGKDIASDAERIAGDMGYLNSRGRINGHPKVRRFLRYHGPQRVRLMYDALLDLTQEAATERERARQMEETLHHLCVRMELQLAGTGLPWIKTWIDLVRASLGLPEERS